MPPARNRRPKGECEYIFLAFSFPLFFFLGEGFGVPFMVPGMAAYFFFCQFMLSQGSLILGPACVGTFAGAVAASLVARRAIIR